MSWRDILPGTICPVLGGKCCSPLAVGTADLTGFYYPDSHCLNPPVTEKVFVDQDKKTQGLDSMWYFIMASVSSSVNVEIYRMLVSCLFHKCPSPPGHLQLVSKLDLHSGQQKRKACPFSSPPAAMSLVCFTGKKKKQSPSLLKSPMDGWGPGTPKAPSGGSRTPSIQMALYPFSGNSI